MTEKWIESPRGKTHYWISRRPGAPAVFFLHGLTADHTLFESQLGYFIGRFTVLAWDSPAHGKSRPYSDFSYLHCAVELKAILDCEGIARCTLVGQSMGGFQAQVFLAHWPERVNGFVAIDSCPFGTDYYSKSDLWWLRHVEGLSRLYPAQLLKRAVARSVSRTEYGRSNMKGALKPYSGRELSRLMGQGYTAFLRENTDIAIPCPAILLLGEHDRTGKVRAYMRAWQQKTGLPLYTVRGAAHNANADNPLCVNRILHAFFNSLPAAQGKQAERPELRVMCEEDKPVVLEMLDAAWREGSFCGWNPLRAVNAPGACRRLICAESRVAGWCGLEMLSADEALRGVAELRIVVTEKLRGQGFGALLLADMVRESRKMGIYSLSAAVPGSNPAAIRLLESAGFRHVGVRERLVRGADGAWQDVTLLERRSSSEPG